MRPISTDDFALAGGIKLDPGAVPELRWIDIASLRVDETYQRPIERRGRANVFRIAENFSWSKFAPIVVSPVEGGLYALIDGQHRCTAALLIGIKQVPAIVMVLTLAQQAAAFAAINGNVTAMTPLSVHRAAIAAGDKDALRIEGVAKAGGVRVLGYPTGEKDLKPGDTMAIGALRSAVRLHGDAIVTLALRCITQTKNNLPGGVSAAAINAIVITLSNQPQRVTRATNRVIEAFDRISIKQHLDKARTADREAGQSIFANLAQRLTKALERHLEAEA